MKEHAHFTRPAGTWAAMFSVVSVPGILAIVVTFWMLALFSYLLAWKMEVPLDDKVVIIIVQGILNLAIAVFMFYFGSSWGSQRKDQLIANMPPPTQNCCRPSGDPNAPADQALPQPKAKMVIKKKEEADANVDP